MSRDQVDMNPKLHAKNNEKIMDNSKYIFSNYEGRPIELGKDARRDQYVFKSEYFDPDYNISSLPDIRENS